MSETKVNSSLSGKLEKTQINSVQKIPDITGASIGESSVPEAASLAFHPYRFNGKTYTAETDLLRAMLEQPEEGLKDLWRGILSHHYYGMNEEKKGDLVSSAEMKLGSDTVANRRLLTSLIWSLRPDYREIAFNGRVYANGQDLGRAFIDAGTKEALTNKGLSGDNYPLTSVVKEFVISGIPEDYVTIVLKNAELENLFSKTADIWNNDEQSISNTEFTLILGYALCDDRRIPIGGKIYESPEAFRKDMADLVSKDRMAYMKLMETVRADLDCLEMILPDAASREAITRSFDDLKFAVFGDNEYHFKNEQEFLSHIEKLVNEDKPYEIRSLLNRYNIPLKQVSEKVWGKDSLNNLQKTVAGFIRIGEYLFTGEKAFREFMIGIKERSRWDPAFILSFVKVHRDSLDSAAKTFPGIREEVSALYAASDAVIVFDEELFPDITAFKAFVTDIINRGSTNPGYLLEFVKRHRSTIDSLMKHKETKAVLKPLTELSESFIVFDFHVFATVPAFESYLNDIMAAGRNAPDYLCRFVSGHSRELEELRRDSRCKQILNSLYAARNQVVSLDELVFRTIAEFREFMEQILSIGKENPAYLRRFVQKHEKALNAFSSDSVLSSVVAPVIAAGNSVIELDEYVFSDASGFTGFARKLTAEKHEKPLRGADFVREHKSGLEALKGTEVLVSAIKELQVLENTEEKGECITVNGTRYSSVTIKKGDYFKFGRYPQKSSDTNEPIEWLVLEVNEYEALLVSRYGLDCKQYHRGGNITWEQCDLRNWLNHEFLKAAFSAEDLQRIKLSEVTNDNNRKYDTCGGNNTRDRIFCLSIAEAERYFKNDRERMCRPTALTKEQGVYFSADGHCWWWLRSPGCAQDSASSVYADGELLPNGCRVECGNDAVRPALWLILNL